MNAHPTGTDQFGRDDPFGGDDPFGRDRAFARLRGLVDAPAADADRYAAGVWSVLVEPGDAIAGALVQSFGADGALGVFGSAHAATVLGRDAGIPAADLAAALRRWRPRIDSAAIADAFRGAERARARLLTPGDPEWPAGLADLGPHQPIALWARGNAGVMRARSIAIVGARAATSYGEHVAGEIAAGLCARGILVVSGAAYGIDGAAHRAALAAGAPTVAWLAGGVDRPYPSGHEDLLARVVRSGVVVSEVPCGAAPTKWRFLARNRLIAASTAATVVVEAGARSGSLNTAGHAAELGRPLAAVPGPVTSAASAGCHRMLREFDAVCVTDAAEAAELVGDELAPPTRSGAATDERTRVLDALSFRAPREVADIARRSGVAPGDVRRILGLLSLEALAHGSAEGWVRPMSR